MEIPFTAIHEQIQPFQNEASVSNQASGQTQHIMLVEPTIETAQKLYLLHCYFSIIAKSPHMLVIFPYNIFVHIYIYTYMHINDMHLYIYIYTLLVDFALFSVGQTIQFAAYIRPQVRAKARHHLGKWHRCIPWRCHPSRPLAPTKVVKSS